MAKAGSFQAIFVIAMAFMLPIQSVFGEIVCENLPKEICAFSISSAGLRCVLEKYMHGREVRHQCRTSPVRVESSMAGWIEGDRCIQTCGVDRSWAGISSDPLMELQFLESLCSSPCYEGCPNIVDLYFNLAAAEGVFLPRLCESLKDNPRRGMVETFKSGFIAPPAPASLPAPSLTTPVPVPAPASLPATPKPHKKHNHKAPASAPKPPKRHHHKAPSSAPAPHGHKKLH